MDEGRLKQIAELTLPEKLFLDRFRVDSTSHLAVNQDACRECSDRVCLDICPTEVYRWDSVKKEVTVSYEGCLECGTCRIACKEGAIDWRNPRGGFGISYRYG